VETGGRARAKVLPVEQLARGGDEGVGNNLEPARGKDAPVLDRLKDYGRGGEMIGGGGEQL